MYLFLLFTAIAQYKPTDGTTNPSLLYAAAQIAKYHNLVDDAISFGKAASRLEYPPIMSNVGKPIPLKPG